MSESQYIIERGKLTDRLEEYNEQLGILAKDSASAAISDDDFIRTASEFILSRQLQEKQYIYYKKLATVTDPEVLSRFFHGLIDSVAVTYGRITNVVFLNGISLTFTYKEPPAK